MVTILIDVIRTASGILTLLVFVDVLLHYFLDPYHPLRRTLDSIVEPLLAPIRRYVPPLGMIDFSAWILIILIQFVERVLIQLLR